MPYVVTAAASLTCKHGFAIPWTTDPHVLVSGSAVVVGVGTPKCTAPTSQTSVPCTTVSVPSNAFAARMTSGGHAVLLDAVKGATTNGIAAGASPLPVTLAGVQQNVEAS